MPYRSRRIDWRLYTEPASRGIAEEARASENLSRSILSGLMNVGQGIASGRREAESRRRYDREADRADRAMTLRENEYGLRQAQHLEDIRDRQAYDTEMLDALGLGVEAVQAEAAQGGAASPESAEVVRRATDALGGPGAAQARLERRASGGG